MSELETALDVLRYGHVRRPAVVDMVLGHLAEAARLLEESKQAKEDAK